MALQRFQPQRSILLSIVPSSAFEIPAYLIQVPPHSSPPTTFSTFVAFKVATLQELVAPIRLHLLPPPPPFTFLEKYNKKKKYTWTCPSIFFA